MEVAKSSVDRRIQRTHQILLQAFLDVMREKRTAAPVSIREIESTFVATSIHDITERANVNRGTFYLHFSDKYTLVDEVIRGQFRQALTRELPEELRWDSQTLQTLIRAVLTNFEDKYHHRHHTSRILAPLLERAMQAELAAILLTSLKQTKGVQEQNVKRLETISGIASWTIFGTALQWSQEEIALSREQMAHAIMLALTQGISPLAPESLSQ